jgi:3-hydroxymyristoyl/3-hydroxydecanoyl-(acyl carrier protein) dehydratase
MTMKKLYHQICRKPFLFVDDITEINETEWKRHFTFGRKPRFFMGHFEHHPVTPVI